MRRIYLTQIFPRLLPLRRRQRLFFFYAKMRLDGRRYASGQEAQSLPYRVFTASCPMVNTATGFDLIYQENKIFNLKLAARQLHGLVIRPGETFSFWHAVRGADREIPYKEGLVERYGTLTTEQGGGLCMLSNLLFWMLLHTPLTVTERHGHTKKDFPEPPSEAVKGADATVSEGWLDLKAVNDTDRTFQLWLRFDDETIYGDVFTDRAPGTFLEISNGPAVYVRRSGAVFEEVEVLRTRRSAASGTVLDTRVLYVNRCQIGYALPEGTPIQEVEV